MIRVHIHDQKGHRVLDQGRTVDFGTVLPRDQNSQTGTAQSQQGGTTHQIAAQMHEAAAEQHVGRNYGAQNPVSRAHSEAAKAHKAAHSLLGKPGYPQASHWANSATQHARRLSSPPGQDASQPAPQPAVRTQGQQGPDIKAGANTPQPRPQRPPQPYRGYEDYGTTEGARKRSQGVGRPGAPGYSNPARQAIARPNTAIAARTAQTAHPNQTSYGPEERRRDAARLAHLSQASANPFAGRQHEAEMNQIRSRLQSRSHDARTIDEWFADAASPKAPGTPKPPPPPKPPAPKNTAPQKPQKPPAPKPPPKPPAPPKPNPGASLVKATQAPLRAAHAAHGVLEEIQRWQELGQHDSRDSVGKWFDTGTALGAKRGLSTKRHLAAEDEAKKRRNWSSHRSIDTWWNDWDESQVTRGGNPENTGQFSSSSGGGSSEGEGEKPKEEKKTFTKEDSPAQSLLARSEKTPSAAEFMDPSKGYISTAEQNAMNDVLDAQKATGLGPMGTKASVKVGGYTQEDGSYTPARLRKHDEILNKWFSADRRAGARPAEGEAPQFIMLGGRGGSGKSYFTKGRVDSETEPMFDKKKYIVIDSDDFKKELGSKGWDAGLYHEEASDLVDQALERARRLGLNVIFDATMKTEKSALKNLNAYKDAGFKTGGYYMHTPPAVAARNSINRFKTDKGDWSGRFVPPEVVLGNTTNEETFDNIRHLFDDWAVYANMTGRDPQWYASKSGKEGFNLKKAAEASGFDI